MGGRRVGQLPADLSRAAQRFQAWRSRRSRGTRIPDVLWRTAASLADKYGLSSTASALQVDYYALKRRMEESERVSPGVTRADLVPTFLELSSGSLSASGTCEIEYEQAAGGTWRVRLQGYPAPDLAALCRSFGESR